VIFLLDSTTIIYALNGQGQCRRRLNSAAARGRVATSILAVAELRYGADKSSHREENHTRIDRELELLDILAVTPRTARIYGEIRAHVEGTGSPKGDRGTLDLMIAATAIENVAVLITHDDGLLDGSIPGLNAEDWYV
jgi:tRNA(fMet)-specific endonuclease VapC